MKLSALLLGLLLAVAAPIGCSGDALVLGDEELGRTSAPLQTGEASWRLRVLSYNTHLVSEIFYGLTSAVLDITGNDSVRECKRISNAVLSDNYDVLVLSEIFDEDALDCVIKELSPQYPFYAGKLEHGVPDVEEDSGLLIMSRLPFVSLPAPVNDGDIGRFYNGPGQNNPKGYANSITFDPDSTTFPDSLAAKGVIHVRVSPRAGLTYDILGTHMQADEEGEPSRAMYRKYQFEQIKKYVDTVLPAQAASWTQGTVLIAGDLNIEGLVDNYPNGSGSIPTLETPSPALLSSEYGMALWPGFNGSSFYDVWRTTSDVDHGVTHSADGSYKRLDYFLTNGGGYYNPPFGSPRQTGVMTPEFIYPQWIRTAHRGVGSDHDAIALEIGPSSSNGAAWAAKPIVAQAALEEPRFIRAGQNAWFRLPLPGTYSIGLSEDAIAAGITYDVFPESDLGWRLGASPLFDERRERAPLCRLDTPDCTLVKRTLFGGSQPLYVRVYAPRGDVTGGFKLSIERHDCSTPTLACELKPNAPLVPVNAQANPTWGRSYFVFSTVPTPGSTMHNAEITLNKNGGTQTQNLVKLVRHRGDVSNPVISTHDLDMSVFGTSATLALGGDEHCEMEVIPPQTGQQFSIGWSTDVTVMRSRDSRNLSISAYCAGESGGDWAGSDEVLLSAYADGNDNGEKYYDDVDTTESIDLPLRGFGFATTSRIRARELVGGMGGSVDNEGYIDIGPLPRSVEQRLWQQRLLSADGLRLKFEYSLVHSAQP